MDSKFQMSLTLNNETNDLIEKLCKEGEMNVSDLFRKSLALMMVALKHKKEGHHLVALDKKNQLVSEIVGI